MSIANTVVLKIELASTIAADSQEKATFSNMLIDCYKIIAANFHVSFLWK